MLSCPQVVDNLQGRYNRQPDLGSVSMANTAQESAGVLEKAENWVQQHEIPRKVLHGSIAIITLYLYVHGTHLNQVTPVLIAMLVPIATIEVFRFASPGLNRAYIQTVGPLMRESEKNGAVNGVIWYLAGLIIVFSIFPKDLSVLSVLLLSWADLSASTIGRAYGKYTPQLYKGKSLAGSFAAFVCGIALTWLWYGYYVPAYKQFNLPQDILWTAESSRLSLLSYSVIVGVVVAVAELFPIIDDNFSIPVVSATALWVVLQAAKRN